MNSMKTKKKLGVFGVKFFPSRGGTSRVAENIVRELKNKYDITIYCYDAPKAKEHMSGVKVITLPKMPFGSAGVFVFYLLTCIHILLFKKFDVIHAHKTDAAFFLPFLVLKSKVLATSHEAPYHRDKWNRIGKAYFRWMEKIFVKSSALLTSVSEPLSEYYYRNYKREVLYVPNGIEEDDTRNHQAADAILAKHQVEGEFLFFAARRIMSTKGCHTFLQAMNKINYQGPIVIAGEASHTQSYMNEIERLSENLDVKYVGFIDSKPTLMSMLEKAGMFIFPSEHEGLSLMLLEAGSTGKTPIICSDIPEKYPGIYR